MHQHTQTRYALPDEPYVDDLEFCSDTLWGAIVTHLQAGTDDTRWMRDPDAIRCVETGKHPSDIYLGRRFYNDDELGCPDGPLRADTHLLADSGKRGQVARARTALGHMTKRQRKAARKARRAAKRAATVDVPLLTLA